MVLARDCVSRKKRFKTYDLESNLKCAQGLLHIIFTVYTLLLLKLTQE